MNQKALKSNVIRVKIEDHQHNRSRLHTVHLMKRMYAVGSFDSLRK